VCLSLGRLPQLFAQGALKKVRNRLLDDVDLVKDGAEPLRPDSLDGGSHSLCARRRGGN
jgi:hypothetical protein